MSLLTVSITDTSVIYRGLTSDPSRILPIFVIQFTTSQLLTIFDIEFHYRTEYSQVYQTGAKLYLAYTMNTTGPPAYIHEISLTESMFLISDALYIDKVNDTNYTVYIPSVPGIALCDYVKVKIYDC